MLLQFFRHGSNGLLCAGAVVLVALGSLGRPALGLPFVALGVLLFFMSEYTTHRFLLHARPAPWPFVLSMQRRLHYDHHLEPARLDLLFLPPWALVPALGLFVFAYALISHSLATTLALLLGNLLGLVFYEWVHFVAHVPFRPLTPYGRWIKKYHLRHHFLNERMWFGVTNPSLDVVYRTYAKTADAERSTSTRELFR
jgi:hypothetical protein